jgi:hypothetical protein
MNIELCNPKPKGKVLCGLIVEAATESKPITTTTTTTTTKQM